MVFTGEDETDGLMTGFSKNNERDYRGQICLVKDVCVEDDDDPTENTWVCEFSDGTEAIILEINLREIVLNVD